MIAVDTNILVYAHRPEFPFHAPAMTLMSELASGTRPWGMILHCLIEFAGAVSHPRRFLEPSSASRIQDQIEAWMESPTVVLLEDGPPVLDAFLRLMRTGSVSGPMVHDARIAAVCIASGVDELLTCDRDYNHFPALKTRNPFVSTD